MFSWKTHSFTYNMTTLLTINRNIPNQNLHMNEKQFSAVATRVNEVVQTSKVSQILLSLITNKNSSPFFFSPRLSEIKIEKPPPLKNLSSVLYITMTKIFHWSIEESGGGQVEVEGQRKGEMVVYGRRTDGIK